MISCGTEVNFHLVQCSCSFPYWFCFWYGGDVFERHVFFAMFVLALLSPSTRSTWSPSCTGKTPPSPWTLYNWSHKLRSVTQDYLGQCDHWLVVFHQLSQVLRQIVGITEATWWIFPWTQVLQVFSKESSNPVLTLQPVQLVEIFLQSFWQAAYIKPLLQHHLQ